jgi:ATP-dependent helicase/nuclease subunit A
MHVLRVPQQRRAAAPPAAETAPAPGALPGWLGRQPDWRASSPPAEPARPRPLAPSRPEEAAFGPVPQAQSPIGRETARGSGFARGTLIHGLLQHLPDLPPGERAAAGGVFLSRPGSGLDAAEARRVLAQCLAVLDHPALAAAFAPGSRAEVPVAGEAGGVVITGVIDRLAVSATEVVAIDFKTGRPPPVEAERTPVLYLRQMAAYRALLRAIFPGRAVVCALVWTEAAAVTTLDDALLDAHAPGQRIQAAGS